MQKRHGPWFFLGLGGLLLLGAALASCAPDTSAPTLDLATRPTEVSLPQSGQPDTAAQPVSELVVDATATYEPFVDVACLDCHRSEGQLKALAVEEVQAESLS